MLSAVLLLAGLTGVLLSGEERGTGVLLPDGREFILLEKPLQFIRRILSTTKTRTRRFEPGTEELPFLTINRARRCCSRASACHHAGVYRERVDRRRGTGPTI